MPGQAAGLHVAGYRLQAAATGYRLQLQVAGYRLQAAERAAGDLFGEESAEVEAVRSAFTAVGIVTEPEESEGDVDTGAEPLPPVSSGGQQRGHWVATVAAELDGDNSLWMVKPTWEFSGDWEAITQLTKTQVFAETGNAITAPLNGEFLLFIDSDNNLRYIDTDGSDEEVINDDGDWSSISLLYTSDAADE